MFKRMHFEQSKMYKSRDEYQDKKDNEELKSSEQEEEYKEPETRNWYETRKEGQVLLKVIITNKS